MEQNKSIIIHGFEREDVFQIMRVIKENIPDSKDIVFAMSTPTNLTWPLAEVISHTRKEHEEMKAARQPQNNND